MNKLLIFFFSFLFASFIQAQNIAVFEDDLQQFYIFDTDHFFKAEHMPVKQFWVGKKYVAYINNQNRFKMYFQGEVQDISLAKVVVRATDHYLVYFVDEQVWLFDGNTISLLDPWIKSEKLEGDVRRFSSIAVSDSIIGFTNSFERFITTEKGQKEEIELWDVLKVKAGENIIAYVDNNGVFKAFYQSERHLIEDRAPRSFVPKTDIIAYVDDFGTFKVWYKNEITELQEIVPRKYYTGDKMVAYLDDLQHFSCFYDGEIYDILPYKPNAIKLQDNVLTYRDNRDFLYAFYKGKETRLAAYKPNKVIIQDDLVVFQNLDGYIMAFFNGELLKVSEQIASNFQVYNEVILYQTNDYTWKAYSNGKIYEYLP